MYDCAHLYYDIMPLYIVLSSEDLFYVNVFTPLHPSHTAKLTGPGRAGGGAIPPLPPIGWGGEGGEAPCDAECFN